MSTIWIPGRTPGQENPSRLDLIEALRRHLHTPVEAGHHSGGGYRIEVHASVEMVRKVAGLYLDSIAPDWRVES